MTNNIGGKRYQLIVSSSSVYVKGESRMLG
jgi:hypothetical protein